ncbi:hypothetical protein J8J04_01860 ['Fragaria x ananassa' phyllody phytoplasma]|uniref:Uncharacterized protein n=1 Tax='Fragaria x ananassa' phyllody phytoplasma TaxID=2358428 RepID=A0ABS5K3E0_9MOLU|nr:hypothetical protein ['Fragaria x ananassa' phyllody phytoplasma]MBS2126428.1 hypothetical protein ['Fragaria x ananassa' phyllody phytoplasma]
MNQTPKKALIKENNLYPRKHKFYQTLLQNKNYHLILICLGISVNLITIVLFKDKLRTQDPYYQLTYLYLTAMVSGMFLGGLILGLKKGAMGVSLGVFVGSALGLWLSLLTKGHIISWLI